LNDILRIKNHKKLMTLIWLLTSSTLLSQTNVTTERGIPSNNANNAIGAVTKFWINTTMAPPASNNYPNQQNWWSILQTQFGDVRYDAQLAFGLNQQDLWLRYNYNGSWQNWKQVVTKASNGQLNLSSNLTIAGAPNLSGAWLLVGSTDSGLGLDHNEIVFAGTDG
tara:strand:+ start:2538 stop:3035 length:498 start_codon:yes stop_codon:yes gene_type:complete